MGGRILVVSWGQLQHSHGESKHGQFGNYEVFREFRDANLFEVFDRDILNVARLIVVRLMTWKLSRAGESMAFAHWEHDPRR